MGRIVRSLLGAVVVAAAVATPVIAVKPVGDCPNPRFTAYTYPEFRQVSLDVGVAEDQLGAEHEAQFDAFDKNADGLVCFMDLPDNAGTLDGGVFNAIDNTARVR
jgi:hypothetical protein